MPVVHDLGAKRSDAYSGDVETGVVVDSTLADADEIRMVEWESLTVIVPTGSAITTITVYVSTAAGGTYVPHNIFASSAPVTPVAHAVTVAAAQAYTLKGLESAAYVKLLGNADGVVSISVGG